MIGRRQTGSAAALVLCIMVCFTVCVRAEETARRTQPGMVVFTELGYTQAEFDFVEQPTDFERHFIDVEIGLLRGLRTGSSFRLGSGIGLLTAVDRPLRDSYSLISIDALVAEYAPRLPVRARLGLGLLRAFAPVNELALAALLSVATDVGPFAVGVKGRVARFEIDFEPHAEPPPAGGDTKYDVLCIGAFLSYRFSKE